MTIGNHEYNYQFLLFIPPSKPPPKRGRLSPTGKGAENKAFFPWGKRERGSLIISIIKLTIF